MAIGVFPMATSKLLIYMRFAILTTLTTSRRDFTRETRTRTFGKTGRRIASFVIGFSEGLLFWVARMARVVSDLIRQCVRCGH